MRVLHLYSGNLYGGIERVLVTLGRAALPAADQHFGLFFDGRLADELRAAGSDVHVMGRASLSRPWRILAARRRLRHVVARVRPDVVLAHSPWALAAAGASIGNDATRVLWLHNPPTRAWWPDRAALRQHPDLVLANSEWTARASADSVTVDGWLYPPVVCEHVTEGARLRVRSELGASPGDVVVLQASRIEAWKGLSDHLTALALLKHVPHWVAWIAGAPQRRHEQRHLDELQALAVRSGIADRVRFLGHRTDMPALMAAADIYCQPNRLPEPFGVALVEALLAARPVITTTPGALADEIAAGAGATVAAGNVPALAEALRSLVLSPAARDSAGRHGRALAEALCSPERQISQLAHLLERAQASRGRPAA